MNIQLDIYPDRAPSLSRRVRAAAEIELILLIPLFITILFVIATLLKLGPARLANVYNANEQALNDAVAVAEPTLENASSPEPPPYPTNDTATLPNHVHVSEPQTQVLPGKILSSAVTLSDHAVYISPALTYSRYPAPQDQEDLGNWFSTQAEQAKGSIEVPLDLSSPAFPP